jgi:hypothetical protein
MPPEKQPPTPKREMSDDDVDRLIYEGFCVNGAFVPQTPDEVEQAEANFDENTVELPASLRDPFAILKRPIVQRGEPRRSPVVDQTAIDNLACAARNGGDIPPEIEKAMDKDEKEVEGEHENGEK